jgi:thymidylate synthase (FAD)
MKLIEEGYEILFKRPRLDMYREIEIIGRNCYKSEALINDESSIGFVNRLMQKRHYAMLEHTHVTVRWTADRGFTHAAVRHRIGAYAQESTIYCNYSRARFGGELSVIQPKDLTSQVSIDAWRRASEAAEKAYMTMIADGVTAEIARAVLPTCTKAVLIATYDLRQWRHFLSMRADPADHPMTQRLAGALLAEFKEWLPEIFENVRPYSLHDSEDSE